MIGHPGGPRGIIHNETSSHFLTIEVHAAIFLNAYFAPARPAAPFRYCRYLIGPPRSRLPARSPATPDRNCLR